MFVCIKPKVELESRAFQKKNISINFHCEFYNQEKYFKLLLDRVLVVKTKIKYSLNCNIIGYILAYALFDQ